MSVPPTMSHPACASSHPAEIPAHGLNHAAIAESGAATSGKSMRDQYAKWSIHPQSGPDMNPDASTLAA